MFSRGARCIAAVALLFASIAAHADVVKLTGNRVLRVVGITEAGPNAVLALEHGGSVTVPLSDIESIAPEPAGASLCAASPYRCQDRALMLVHRAQAQSVAGAVAARRRPAVP